jgi:hypothetical protein
LAVSDPDPATAPLVVRMVIMETVTDDGCSAPDGEGSPGVTAGSLGPTAVLLPVPLPLLLPLPLPLPEPSCGGGEPVFPPSLPLPEPAFWLVVGGFPLLFTPVGPPAGVSTPVFGKEAPGGGLDSTGGLDSAGGLDSVGGLGSTGGLGEVAGEDSAGGEEGGD